MCIEFATSSRRIWQQKCNWTCWEFIQWSWLQSSKNWVTTANGWVHTADTTQLDLICSLFSFQVFYQIRWQSSWASCKFNTHCKTPTQQNSTAESRRRRYWPVCIGLYSLLFFSSVEMYVMSKTCNTANVKYAQWLCGIRNNSYNIQVSPEGTYSFSNRQAYLPKEFIQSADHLILAKRNQPPNTQTTTTAMATQRPSSLQTSVFIRCLESGLHI